MAIFSHHKPVTLSLPYIKLAHHRLPEKRTLRMDERREKQAQKKEPQKRLFFVLNIAELLFSADVGGHGHVNLYLQPTKCVRHRHLRLSDCADCGSHLDPIQWQSIRLRLQ